jgi:hypothetical protein
MTLFHLEYCRIVYDKTIAAIISRQEIIWLRVCDFVLVDLALCRALLNNNINEHNRFLFMYASVHFMPDCYYLLLLNIYY